MTKHSDLYEIYWAYPRHLNPGKSMEAVEKAMTKYGLTKEQMLEYVKAYAEQLKEKPLPKYAIPHMTTWVNQARWWEDFDERHQMVTEIRDQEAEREQRQQQPQDRKLNFL